MAGLSHSLPMLYLICGVIDGAGALVTAPIAERLTGSTSVARTFSILGFAYFAIILLSGSVARNPPAGAAAPRDWTFPQPVARDVAHEPHLPNVEYAPCVPRRHSCRRLAGI